jgi:murein DD-endopeptidase MepM/ murein hydrolase activator NlpD
MAFVILSTGGLADSVRTLRTRTLAVFGSAGLVALLAGGLAAGYWLGAATGAGRVPATPAAPVADSIAAGNRAVIDRVGALAAQVSRLEAEAVALGRRVGLEGEVREQLAAPAGPATPTAPAPAPAEPAGGPLVAPLPATAGLVAAVGSGLGSLEASLDRLEAALGTVARAATARDLESMAFPSRYPVAGFHRITSGFGNRYDPFTRRRARHTGIDIAAPRGTPILASAGGRVRFAGYRAAYGNTVEIDHGNGLVTRYAHAARVLVRPGQVVLPRQPVALVGSTGRSTGPHLHFEVLRRGVYLEPRRFLAPAGT